MDGATSDQSSTGSFTLLDYGLFLSMLSISGLVGVYYGFFSKRKQNNTAEYILGNKQMKLIPVAISLIVSHVAGTTMLGVPADVYANGSQYVMSFISIFFTGLSLIYLYIPVFYDLGFASCFTYLEKRFDHKVKLTASLVFTLDCVLSSAIVIYVPALALNQVTGINLHLITVSTCVLCVFYTTLGGLRGVVWTDTLQFGSIMGSIIAVVCVGTSYQGGVGNVLDAAQRGDRLVFFNMNASPLEKSTFWTVTVGLSMMWISQKSASQSTIQRFLSLPTRTQAKRCVWIYCFGVALIKTASCYIGLLLYAYYEKCDPVTSGQISKLDQILPKYSLEMSSSMPGLTGLFIAGIFASGLSTLSTTLNALAATIFEDLIKPRLSNLSERSSSNVMKAIVIGIGVLVLSLVFVVERLGAILQVAYSLHGVTAGTLLGIFTIGMLSPKINTKGIITGAIASLLIVGTIMVGAQIHPKEPSLTLSTEHCTFTGAQRNGTTIWMEQKSRFEEVPWLFRISFMYYTLIGVTVVAVVSYLVSIATGGHNEVDEKLLATFVRTKVVNDKVEYEMVPNAVLSPNKDASPAK